MENWGALEINNYFKNPIVIYDNGLFEKKPIKVSKTVF
jgi:hypothetical protein